MKFKIWRQKGTFGKYNWIATDEKLGPYDKNSIMHYDGKLRNIFKYPIIVDKLTGEGIEVNKEMSQLDIQKINEMYPCKPSDPLLGMSHTVWHAY